MKLFAPTKRGQKTKRGFGMTSGQFGHGSNAPLKVVPGIFPKTTFGELSTCDKYITPPCIRALYGIPKSPEYAYGIPRTDNSLGIFEEGDYYSQVDLDLFFANFTPNIPKGTHPLPAFIDGGDAPVGVKDAGGESDLDFQLSYPLIYPQTITLYQTDDEFYATNPNSTSIGGLYVFPR